MDASDREKLEQTSAKPCVLKGYKLVFNALYLQEKGLANLVCDRNNPNNEVRGVLYQLPKEAIDYLETHEPGYHGTKVKVDVEGKETEAVVLMADTVGEEVEPNKAYLTSTIEGADEHVGHRIQAN